MLEINVCMWRIPFINSRDRLCHNQNVHLCSYKYTFANNRFSSDVIISLSSYSLECGVLLNEGSDISSAIRPKSVRFLTFSCHFMGEIEPLSTALWCKAIATMAIVQNGISNGCYYLYERGPILGIDTEFCFPRISIACVSVRRMKVFWKSATLLSDEELSPQQAVEACKLRDIEDPTVFKQLTDGGDVRHTLRPRSTPQKHVLRVFLSLILISVGDWVNPRAWCGWKD
jgi:hypothetical protein